MSSVKIPICRPLLGKQELDYVADCLKSGWVSSKGAYNEQFEREFSRYVGAKYGISVVNGTCAIHLALASLGIKEGDEVIVPTFTTVASTNPIIYLKARPVLIDAESYSWNIDVAKVEEKITRRTKAIMVVHIYGHPVDMDPVVRIAKEHNLYLVEDAAEAHGAEYKGNRVGSISDVGCFSFYANKIITTGEGGMVVTNDEEIAYKARSLSDLAYGKGEKRFLHEDIGFNYRMTNIQAALGVAQMKSIDDFVETRRLNAQTYNSLLSGIEGITLPPEAPWAKNVYWMYSILVEPEFKLTRDELMAFLNSYGVDTRPFFYPIHLQPPYRKYYKNERYPVAENLSEKGINLPSGNYLMSNEIKVVTELIGKASK